MSDLPDYTPEQASLFDDSFASDAFDPTIGDRTSRWQRELTARTRHADGVVRVRISTVSRSSAPAAGSEWIHELVLVPLEAPLAGEASGEPIAVQLAPQSPAVGLVRRVGSSLVGKTVILFFKTYKDEGKIAIHWRAEADTNAVRNAVTVAAALGN